MIQETTSSLRPANLMTPNPHPSYGTFAPPLAGRALLWLARHSFLGRGKWRDWVYALFRRIHDGPVDTTLWGAPIRIDPRTNPLERRPMLRFDRVDIRERRVMHSFLDHEGAVMADLGANMGLYAFDAALNGPSQTKVIAVEANPSMAARLGFNVETMLKARSRNLEHFTLFPVAVGAEEGSALMDVDRPEHIASLAVVPENGIPVPVRPLLAMLKDAEIDHIDYLKIDVEGYEGEALGPFLEHADDALLPRAIQLEHTGSQFWTRDLFALLEQRGYAEINRFGMNAIWARDSATRGS